MCVCVYFCTVTRYPAEAMSLEFTPEEQQQLELLLSKREKATGMPQAKPPKVGSSGAMTNALRGSGMIMAMNLRFRLRAQVNHILLRWWRLCFRMELLLWNNGEKW